MEGTRGPKRLMEGTLEGRRGRGRPRGRWSDGVEKGMRVLGVRSWKEAVSNRLKWRNMLDQAKPHPGLRALMKMMMITTTNMNVKQRQS
ncbi:jg18122 [Pararge aegeria aegeria]|uniref:Jg18122 protein n=1 Tax=Pararge aegeria aegeria TaxID=348720 RepID=A0A8S4S0Y6_9NEOP|nr:jg18122 [Pararge aegeria aegeria]